MDPRLKKLLKHCFDRRDTAVLAELKLETLERLHSQVGLPMPPARDLASYGYHFESLYCRLDGASPTTAGSIARSVQALALMGDSRRLERLIHTYNPSPAKVSEAYLALARRGHLEAMAVLNVPPQLEWSVLNIALETSNVSLFRQTLARLDFEELRRWPSRCGRQRSKPKFFKVQPLPDILRGLSVQPQCCRLFLLALATYAPALVQPALEMIYPPPRQALTPWLLELLLELVERGALELPLLMARFPLGSAQQARQLVKFMQNHPSVKLNLASVLYDQLILTASLPVVSTLHEAAREMQPVQLRRLLEFILAASLADFAAPEAGPYFQSQYSQLSWGSAFTVATMQEFTLGSALPKVAAQEHALFERLHPLLSKAALETFTEGMARLETQIRLQLLTPEEAFSALYWLWHTGYYDQQQPRYDDYLSCTGSEVLQKLQALKGTLSQRLVLLGLGFEDPLPLEGEYTDARSQQLLGLVEFCAAYQPLEILARLLPAVIDLLHDDPDEFYGVALEAACIHGRTETAAWLVDQHYFAAPAREGYARRLAGPWSALAGDIMTGMSPGLAAILLEPGRI